MENQFKDFVGELTLNYKRTKLPIQKISSSKEVIEFVRPFFQEAIDDHEICKIIHLNRANKVVNIHHLSEGIESSCLVSIKDIARHAIILKVSGVIMIHNHPSGTLRFSEADIKLSKKIKEALQFFEISLLDSLVITREGYESMADNGIL